MKILVIGGTGMLGVAIMLSKVNHNLFGTYHKEKPKSHKLVELDITDNQWVKKVIREINPDAIIHTAAITNVDLCEEKPNLANEVHVIGTKNLVQYAKKKKNIFYIFPPILYLMD